MKASEAAQRKIISLEEEKGKAVKDLTFAEAIEDLEVLKDEQAQVGKELERLPVDGEERSGVEKKFFEIAQKIFVQQKKVQTLQGEEEKKIELAKLEVMAANRKAALGEAMLLAEEWPPLCKRVMEIVNRSRELRVIFENSVPMRRIQTSSSQFVKMERRFIENVYTGFDIGTGKPQFDMKKRVEEAFITGIPERIDVCLKAGWTIVPGQPPLKEEPLDNENSMEVRSLPIPNTFDLLLPDGMLIL
jgi:hypothetical protein